MKKKLSQKEKESVRKVKNLLTKGFITSVHEKFDLSYPYVWSVLEGNYNNLEVTIQSMEIAKEVHQLLGKELRKVDRILKKIKESND